MPWCCLAFFNTKAFAATLAATFAADMAICTVVHFGYSDGADPLGYKNGTLDTFVGGIVRVVCFPIITYVAYAVFKHTAAQSQLHMWQTQQGGEQVGNGNELRSLNGGALAEMREPLRTNSVSSDASILSSTSSNPDKAMNEMKADHSKLMKKAETRKTVVLGILFLVNFAMCLYNGIKCVTFNYGRNGGEITVEGALFMGIIIIVNVEFFLLRDFLDKLTEETGERIKHLHLHPLFFDTGLKCHHCDVCHERMEAPHFMAYRCRTCDFDLCVRCYKKKDRPEAKGFGARALRADGEGITTWSYFMRIIGLSLPFWPLMAVAMTCLLLTKTLEIMAPNIQGAIFDGIIASLAARQAGRPGDLSEFSAAVTKYTIVSALQGVFGGLRSLTQDLTLRNISNAVRHKLFSSIVRMDISFFDAMHTGQLTSRLTNDSSQMVQPLNSLINNLLANLLTLVGGTFMAFHTSWRLSTLAITVVPPITFVYRRYAHWGRNINRSIWQALGDANKTATDAMSNIRTVRAFSTEQHECDQYQDSIDTALSNGKKNAYAQASINTFSTYLNLGTGVLILWYGGVLVCEDDGSMSLGMLITFQLYWNMMNSAFISLSGVFNDLIRASSAAERVLSIMDAKPDVDPDDGDVVARDAIRGHLVLEQVQFRYKTRPENLVLKGIDLDMAPGTVTALVGKSGGGKSTVVHLLMRFYEPSEGTIRLDGRDVKEFSSRSLRTCCGFVAQDTQLFATSFEKNLAYGLGRPYTHEEMVEACKAANAHEFIMETEEQYETRIGEKGMQLSGGQRQRLAIARCFLRRPKLLFLDEATSALDAENEGIVQSSIDSLIERGGCTVTLIAHRLCTVISATQIAVVHKGHIVERGAHDDLVAKGGIYSELVKRQLARDATSMEKERSQSGKGKGKGGPRSVQTEIDELMEEMETSGSLKE